MGGPGRPGYGDLATGETVSTGGLARTEIDGDSDDLAPGTMVGEYRVDGQVGEGGMGRVFAATHPVIAKRAAIKILHPELSVNREAVERFVQEARSVNQIGHPNIVDIFSFGTLPDGRCYFVMEFLRGSSLRDRVRSHRLQLVEAMQISETIAIALEAAHEKGIVHRDLKPDNIFLVEVKGQSMPTVKLLDFGIAKLLGGDGLRAERTRTGNLMGTPAYMSPEQARGHMVDHRTDIYALGCVAYEMLTGWLPFPADNAADMIAKHLFETPPSARIKNPMVPPELDALIQRMLAKEADLRPTLAELRDHLRRGIHAVLYGGHPGTPASGVPYAAAPPYGAYPTPSSIGPQLTPAPPMGSVMQSGSTAAPPTRSKALPILIALVLVAGIATAVGMSMRGGGDKGTAATTPTEPAGASPSVDTVPNPPPVDTAATKPDDATTLTTPPPSGSKPSGKKPHGKKPVGKKPAATVDDDDAPM